MTPLRVVHVVLTEAFAGTERYVANLATATHRLGHDVEVIGGDPAAMVAALPAGVAHRPVSALPDAVRLLRRMSRPDVVHTHLTAADMAASAAFPVPGRRPALVSTRHIAARRGSGAAARAAAYGVRARLDLQIAISRFVAASVDGASEVILTGVPDSAEPSPGAGRTVIVAQRLEAEKDTALALRAWAASGLGEEGWQLRIAGRGAQLTALQALAGRLDVGPSVHFAGFVEDIRAELGLARGFLATAPAEPYGLAVVEAMACGVPVVASAAGGHLETVGAVAGARLFPAGDAAAAAGALRALAGDPAAARDYGAALRAHQRESLTLDAFVRSVIASYERALR